MDHKKGKSDIAGAMKEVLHEKQIPIYEKECMEAVMTTGKAGSLIIRP